MKNEQLANKLLILIRSGYIKYKPQDNVCMLIISDVKGLKKIVNLLNGELRTPKIHQFYYLINWLNKNHAANIVTLPLKDSDLSKDGWLSGFLDSNGSFSIQHTKTENGAKKRKISCRLRIEQRMLDPVSNDSYLKVLTDISNFLNCRLSTRKQKSTNNEYFILTASNKLSLNIIIKYLEKYPFFSSKFLDYKNWKEIVLLIIENKHYTDQAINKTELMKNRMNTQRIDFTWDHLSLLFF
jgi:hypothetical protein